MEDCYFARGQPPSSSSLFLVFIGLLPTQTSARPYPSLGPMQMANPTIYKKSLKKINELHYQLW